MGFLSPRITMNAVTNFELKGTQLMPDMEMPGTVEDALREVAKVKSMVTDAVEEGVRAAVKAIKQGRYAAEDALGEAKHAVKKRPLEAIGIAFAAGVLAGGLLAWLGTRRD
jgi:ElaB/YqjD/DUF883 family membrane-anchored ribosome-binding protein